MKIYWNWEDRRFLLKWIRKSTAGVFLSGRGWFDLWFLLAYPILPVFHPSPEFLNLPGRVGGGGQLVPSGPRPVLFADPVFVFRVAGSFSFRSGALTYCPEPSKIKILLALGMDYKTG